MDGLRAYLRVVPNAAARLFAYPYGEFNDFLVRTFLPELAQREPASAPLAAFTTQAGYLEAGADRWRLPRFVCGDHWKSPEGLRAILDGAR